MLCPNVCKCGTLCHDMREAMGGSVTVYAGFVNGVIKPFAVRGHRKVMSAAKPAEVYSVLTC